MGTHAAHAPRPFHQLRSLPHQPRVDDHRRSGGRLSGSLSDPLRDPLARQGVIILDGGLATALEARGHDIDDPLWSARLLLDEPESIRRLHLDYLEAGADCIVSASYQATIPGFLSRGMTHSEAERMLRRSVELALGARNDFWAVRDNRKGRLRPLVAASVGPYGAYLANGAEYSGDYDLDAGDLAEFHRRRLRILAGAGADLLACETIPSAAEARVLVELLEEVPEARAWLSFSCRDAERISDGTPIASILGEVAVSRRVIAVGVNCTAPEHLGSLIAAARGQTDKPIVAYPNSGESYDAETRSWLPAATPARFAESAAEWAAGGARLIGGCCRTGLEEIRRLRLRFEEEEGLLATPAPSSCRSSWSRS